MPTPPAPLHDRPRERLLRAGPAVLADADPLWPLSAVAAGLLAIVVVEDVTIHRESAADIAID